MQIKKTIYGDKDTGTIGMNSKLDEIHTILVQAKGLKGLFGLIVLCGVALVTIKGWLMSNN
jgi:hypothetical protein